MSESNETTMTTQMGLFEHGDAAPSAADVIAEAEALARLRFLCSWAVKSSHGGWSMRRAWLASEAWQSPEEAERASGAAMRRLQRSKAWTSMTSRQRLDAARATEPFVHYMLRFGRAERTIFCADTSAKVAMRDVEESVRELAAMCDTPADIVVRFVMTGETP